MSKEVHGIWLRRGKSFEDSAWKNTGLTDRGRELLMGFLAGIVEVEEAEAEMVARRGEISLGLILDGEESQETAYACNEVNSGESLIMISRNFLNRAGELVADARSRLKRSDGEVEFDGCVDDYIFLRGVEEAHHAYFYSDTMPEFPDPNAVPLADYDAQEHELTGLSYQLEVAQRKRLPPETISFLEKRIATAKSVHV